MSAIQSQEHQHQKSNKAIFIQTIDQIDKGRLPIDKSKILKAVQIMIDAGNRRNYYVFKDYNHAFNMVASQEIQYDYLHEIIQPQDKVKMFIDFDYKLQQNKSPEQNRDIANTLVNSIIILFARIFMFLNEGSCKYKLLTKTSNDPNDPSKTSIKIEQYQKTHKEFVESRQQLSDSIDIKQIMELPINESRQKFLKDFVQNVTLLHSNTDIVKTQKVSYHILFNRVVFAGLIHLAQFMNVIKDSYDKFSSQVDVEYMKEHRLRKNTLKYVDYALYYHKKGDDQSMRTLRLYGCNKRAVNGEDNRIELEVGRLIKFSKDITYKTRISVTDDVSCVYLTVIGKYNTYIEFSSREHIENDCKGGDIVKEFSVIIKDKFNHDLNLHKFRYYLTNLNKLNDEYSIRTETWFNIGRILYKEAVMACKELETDEESKINLEQEGEQIRNDTYIHFSNTDQTVTQQTVMGQYLDLFDEWSQFAGQGYGGRECIEKTWQKYPLMSLSKGSIGTILHYYKKELKMKYHDEAVVKDHIKQEYSRWKQDAMFNNDHKLLLDSFIDLDFKCKDDLHGVDIIKINEKKLDLPIFEENDFGNPKYKIVGIQSQKSTGKSTTFIKFFKKRLLEEPDANVLVITSKVTLASKLCADLSELNFVKYDDVQGPLDQKRVVVQINSLHRLDPRVTPTYIIIDEIKDLCTYITSDHFNQNGMTQMSYFKLQAIIQACKQMFIFDADLDTSVLTFLRKVIQQQDEYQKQNLDSPDQDFVYSNTEMQVLVNEFKTYQEEGYKFLYQDKIPWLQMIYSDITQGKQIVIASLSQVQTTIIKEQIELFFPGIEIVVFNSLTDKIYKTIQTANVNKHWSKYKVIVYSPTITTGISFDVLNVFHRIYLHICDQSTGALQIFQMAHRIREPIRREIIFTYEIYQAKFPKVDFSNRFILNEQMESKLFATQEDGSKLLRGQSYMVYENIGGKQMMVMKTQKTAYYQLCRNNTKESLFNRHYILALCVAYAKRCGYETGRFVPDKDYQELMDTQLDKARQFNGYSAQKRSEIEQQNAQNLRLTQLIEYDQKKTLELVTKIDDENISYLKSLLKEEEQQGIFFQMKMKDLVLDEQNKLPGLVHIKNDQLNINYSADLERYLNDAPVRRITAQSEGCDEYFEFGEKDITEQNKDQFFKAHMNIKENKEKIDLMYKKDKLFEIYAIREKEMSDETPIHPSYVDKKKEFQAAMKELLASQTKAGKNGKQPGQHPDVHINKNMKRKHELLRIINLYMLNNCYLNQEFYLNYMKEEHGVQYQMFKMFSVKQTPKEIRQLFMKYQEKLDKKNADKLKPKNKQDIFFAIDKNQNILSCISYILHVLQIIDLEPVKLQRDPLYRKNMIKGHQKEAYKMQQTVEANMSKQPLSEYLVKELNNILVVFNITFQPETRMNEKLITQLLDKIFDKFFGIRVTFQQQDNKIVFDNKWINFRYLYLEEIDKKYEEELYAEIKQEQKQRQAQII